MPPGVDGGSIHKTCVISICALYIVREPMICVEQAGVSPSLVKIKYTNVLPYHVHSKIKCDTFKLNMGLKEKLCYIGSSLYSRSHVDPIST